MLIGTPIRRHKIRRHRVAERETITPETAPDLINKVRPVAPRPRRPFSQDQTSKGAPQLVTRPTLHLSSRIVNSNDSVQSRPRSIRDSGVNTGSVHRPHLHFHHSYGAKFRANSRRKGQTPAIHGVNIPAESPRFRGRAIGTRRRSLSYGLTRPPSRDLKLLVSARESGQSMVGTRPRA